MKKRIVIFALILFGFYPTGAKSESYKLNTGYDLYHATLLIGNPQNDEDLTFSARALGYISGFVDGIIFSQETQYNMVFPAGQMSEKERTNWAKKMNFKKLNIPKEGVRLGQSVLIFQKWAKSHPEELNDTTRLCLWRAFVDAFGWK